MYSNAAGDIGWSVDIDGDSSFKMAPMRLAWLSPENALCPGGKVIS